MTYATLSRGVREHLGQRHRFAHSVRVARFAERLALRHGVSTSRARRAGMLHDLARLYPGDRLIDESAARGLEISLFERAHPVVLHARLGAELAREHFGETDAGVLQAIARHTVAAAGMTPLDVVIYLADALEPGRVYAERGALAALAFEDLDRAMLAVLRSSCEYLTLRGESVAPDTAAALTEFERRLTTDERRAVPA